MMETTTYPCTRTESGARSTHCWQCFEEGRDERPVDGFYPAIALVLIGLAIGLSINLVTLVTRLLPMLAGVGR